MKAADKERDMPSNIPSEDAPSQPRQGAQQPPSKPIFRDFAAI
ncbi:hypothetical protein MBELCI_0916 [Limimaricola cinnabarinus LL-001]|uniref:Uncharacterized protein n=1 Tax=Limimaricola cinnabarinus LL-001 TaxID=1337093 RepID=U3AB30_9RHOB|nr:hypothetical protein MBELCI_0916 [Limimaricola cinnabarinus LL-001]